MVDIDKDSAIKAAKINAKGNLAHEFLGYAYYAHRLGFVTKSGVVIHPIEMPKGQVKIALIVGEDTTIKQIENSWWEIIKWREALNEWQGETPNSEHRFIESLQEALSNKQQQGLSYLQLANYVNERVGQLLTEYCGWLSDSAGYMKWLEDSLEGSLSPNSAKNKKQAENNMHSWFYDYLAKPEHNNPGSLHTANLILGYCRPRLSDQERNDLLQDAIRRIQAGDIPFSPNEPVRQRDIRERIDYWRMKQKKVGNIS